MTQSSNSCSASKDLWLLFIFTSSLVNENQKTLKDAHSWLTSPLKYEEWHKGSSCWYPLSLCFPRLPRDHRPPTGNEPVGLASSGRIGFDLTSMCQKPGCWWGIWLAPCKSRGRYQSSRQIRESMERQESGSQRSHYWERDFLKSECESGGWRSVSAVVWRGGKRCRAPISHALTRAKHNNNDFAVNETTSATGSLGQSLRRCSSSKNSGIPGAAFTPTAVVIAGKRLPSLLFTRWQQVEEPRATLPWH